MTLKEALNIIEKLKSENEKLKTEVEELKSKKTAGRKKHDDVWTNSYNDFSIKYSGGMTIAEIVSEGKISRRTAYRYKAYYDELTKKEHESNDRVQQS